MSRNTTSRSATVISHLQTQEDLIKQFERFTDTLKRSANEKNKLVYSSDGPHRHFIEMENKSILIQFNNFVIIHWPESKEDKTKFFSSEIHCISAKSELVLIASANSLDLYSVDLDKIGLLSNESFALVDLEDQARWGCTADNQGILAIWDMKKKYKIQSIQAHKGEVIAIRILSSQRKIITLGRDQTLRIWNKKLNMVLEKRFTSLNKALEANESYIFTQEKIWGFEEMQEIHSFKKSLLTSIVISLVAFSANKNLALYDGINISVFEFENFALKFTIKPDRPIKILSFSKDGLNLLYSDGVNIRQLQLFENIEKTFLRNFSGNVSCLLSRGSALLALHNDDIWLNNETEWDMIGQAKLMTTFQGTVNSEPTRRLSASTNSLKQADFSSRLVASVGNTAHVYSYDGIENSIVCDGDITMLESNFNFLLIYSADEFKIYNIDLLSSPYYTYKVSNAISASISKVTNNLIILCPTDILITNMITGSKSNLICTPSKKLAFFGNEDEFLTITENSLIRLYSITEESEQLSFQIPNQDFTGQLTIFRNLYLFTSSSQGICMSSLQDYIFLALIPIPQLTAFCLSIKYNKIFCCAGNKLYSMINPINSNLFEPIILEFSSVSYNLWQSVKALINNSIEDSASDNQGNSLADFIVMPYCMTPIMILANSNKADVLKAVMRRNFKYLRFMNVMLTPLTLAICRNNGEIIECFMKELILMWKNDPNLMRRIEDDIVELNFKGANKKLEYFYRMSFVEPEDNLLKFGTLKKSPFMAIESKSKSIKAADFLVGEFTHSLNTTQFRSVTADGELLTYKISAFRFSLTEFSQESSEFLESILCSSPEIMKTPMIQAILLYKWEKIKYLIYLQLFLFSIYLLCLSIHIAYTEEEYYFFSVMMILNTVFFLAEIPLFRLSPSSYIQDAWNVLDCSRIFLLYFYAIFHLFPMGIHVFYLNFNLALIILLSWIRGLAFFRIFKRTRYLVRIIIEVAIDVIPFCIVLVYCIASFALVGYSLEDGCSEASGCSIVGSSVFTQFYNEWITQYLLNFGQFDTKDYDFIAWIQFFGASALNTLIMMSMIIALMGNTYKEVQESATIADFKEMASYILEIESIFMWINVEAQRRYFAFCYVPSQLVLGEEESVLDEKLQKLKVKIRAFKQTFDCFNQGLNQDNSNLDDLYSEHTLKYKEILSINAEHNARIIELQSPMK